MLIRDGVHSGQCPFGIVLFGIVPIRDCVHSGSCTGSVLLVVSDFLFVACESIVSILLSF